LTIIRHSFIKKIPRMKKLLLTFSIMISALIYANAKDTATIKTKTPDSTMLKAKADSTIHIKAMRYGKYWYSQYILNGTVLTTESLEACLMAYNPSAIELQQYKMVRKHNLHAGIICAAISISAMIAAGIQVNGQSNQTGSLFSRAPVFCSISISGLIAEFISLGGRNDHFDKAISAYNSRF